MRRAFVPGLVIAAVLVVAAGGLVRARRGRPALIVADKRGEPESGLPVGYWVWAREEAPDGVTEITEADLTGRVGPDGWPGCPENFLCTRRGVRSLAISADGGFHYVANVFTSSDFQHHGSLSGAEVRIAERYSCAHPQWRDRTGRRHHVHWERRGDELRVAIDPAVEGGGWAFAPRPTGRWWVFRRISRATYYDRVLIRLCQPVRGHACALGCFSDRLIGERR